MMLFPLLMLWSLKMSDNICIIGRTSEKQSDIEYLRDFSWDCGWYWGGGYIGNRSLHHHFEGLNNGKNQNLYDAYNEYFTHTKLTDSQIWRLCDLMVQFYAHRKSAECFQYGGHYSGGTTDAEKNSEYAKGINTHIKNVIIPEVRNLLKDVNDQEWRATK